MFKLYLNSFKKIVNFASAVSGFLGIILSIAVWRITPDTMVGVFWIFITLLISIIIILFLFIHSIYFYIKYQENKDIIEVLPKVISINNNNDRIIMYTTKSIYFFKDIDITVCILDENDMETVFCYGKVIHVQDNALQLEINIDDSQFSNISELLHNINSYSKKQFKILPGKVNI